MGGQSPEEGESPPGSAGPEERLLLGRLRATFESGGTRAIPWRLAQLEGILRFLADEAPAIERALASDLGKPAVEGYITDVVAIRREVRALARGLPRWARPRRAALPWILWPGHASVVREPMGVVLVLAPWNYPINLVLTPLAAALAAGNCAVVKPSELAPACAELLAERLPCYVDRSAVAVVQGDGTTASALIDAEVDMVFFTGSIPVARLVMAEAACHLTPVVLELGGKSPAIVCRDADLVVAARRIAWGKFLNAGQTCVAPDYVLVDATVRERFLDALCCALVGFYGEDPRTSPDYGRVLVGAHHERIEGLLRSALSSGARLVVGGELDREEGYIAPTVLSEVPLGCALMDEEIFGPLLPVVDVAGPAEAVAIVAGRPAPLAAYVFSEDRPTAEGLLASLRTGSGCVNTVLHQFGVPSLPFGGVGASGFGNYHGRWGFETFSHVRGVLRKPTRPDLPLAYPPYRAWTRALFRRVL